MYPHVSTCIHNVSTCIHMYPHVSTCIHNVSQCVHSYPHLSTMHPLVDTCFVWLVPFPLEYGLIWRPACWNLSDQSVSARFSSQRMWIRHALFSDRWLLWFVHALIHSHMHIITLAVATAYVCLYTYVIQGFAVMIVSVCIVERMTSACFFFDDSYYSGCQPLWILQTDYTILVFWLRLLLSLFGLWSSLQGLQAPERS